MGEVVRNSDGVRTPRIPAWDKAILVLLVFLGYFAVGIFADYWFDSDHRRNPWLFGLLTLAVFWGILRSAIDWFLNLFAAVPDMSLRWENTQGVQHGTAKDQPVADVLTTAMPGEPFEMFRTTLEAMAAMTTPHVTYLLDGGNDPALQKLCEDTGAIHVNCQGIGGAKAGKLNHCLREYARNPFVLILDPDHIPEPDFLERALPHLRDPRMGFVQVVQAYYNKEESFVAWAAAEQTFGFYGPTLMGLHGVGIPTAIGANCLFRRAALDSIGGHAVHLAEDALTSMRLHAQGWRSTYLPFRGSRGLVPADLGAFYKQQIKWSAGMFLLLLREYPKLFPKFGLAERLHYLGSGTFYFSGVAALLTLFLPIFFLFLRIHAVEMPLGEFLAHLTPYALACVLIHIWISRWYTHQEERLLPWRSMLLDKASWHIYLQGLWNSVLGREVPYIPTPKIRADGARPDLVWPHALVILGSLGAIVFAILTYPVIDSGSWLMIAFAGLNAAMLLPVTLLGLGWIRQVPVPRRTL